MTNVVPYSSSFAGNVRTGSIRAAAKGYLARKNYNRLISSRVSRLQRNYNRIAQGIEYHHIDTVPYNGGALSSTASIVALNLCAQGDSEIQREGMKSTMTSILLRGVINPGTVTCHVRLIVVWDKQTNGALPTITDVLDNTVITGTSHAPRNLEGSERFKFLMDRHFNIPAVTLPTDKGYRELKFFKTLKSSKKGTTYVTKFNAATAAIGSITTGSIIVIALSDVAANGAVIYLGSRVRFMDL